MVKNNRKVIDWNAQLTLRRHLPRHRPLPLQCLLPGRLVGHFLVAYRLQSLVHLGKGCHQTLRRTNPLLELEKQVSEDARNNSVAGLTRHNLFKGGNEAGESRKQIGDLIEERQL